MSQASVWTPLYAAIGEPAARADARPGDVFPPDANITASDSTNAAKLAAEGFVAVPLTAWTTGQQILIGPYAFNWTGSAWAAGTHALLREGREAPEEEVEEDGDGEADVMAQVVEGTIPEVKVWVEDNPTMAEAVLSAEQERPAGPRVTLVTWLEEFIADRDEA